MTTRLAAAALLLGVWILFWGNLSVGNVVSGLAVVGLLFAAFPPAWRVGGFVVRPWPTLKLALHFAGKTIASNVVLIRVVFAKESSVRRGVLGVPLPGCSESLMRLMAHLTALTPGTMTVELRGDPAIIYVHVMWIGDIEATRTEIGRLNRLVVEAFGTADDVAELHAAGGGTR